MVHLIEPHVLLLLFADVRPEHGFVSTYGRDEVSSGPEMLSHNCASSSTRARWIALLPFIYPTIWDTAYFGGIEIIMWTGMRCPSSILLSFCMASLRNTSLRCFLGSP